jgi:hypothetical protein
MKRFASLASFGLSLAALITLSIGASASAATGSNTPSPTLSGQALEIAPPIITLSANPGQTIQTQISLRDISSGNLLVTNEINDFVASGEDGTPKIIMDSSADINPYTLKGWISPIASLLMTPRQIKSLSVIITVPANASPGGHYGVIRFTAAPPELHQTGVSLSASIGSLVLITVNGKVKEGLTLAEFSTNKGGHSTTLFESKPVNFTERIKNIGNVHEQVVGQVTIDDMFGKKIAAVNVNLQARNILPQSIRKFDQPLDSSVLGNKFLFGHYTAHLNLSYGAEKQSLVSTLGFWVIPYRLIGGSILVLVGGFFGLRNFIRRYNQRVIRKATQSSKK